MSVRTGHGPRLFVLDNHDSFTWNLVHRFESLGARVELRQHDEVEVDEALGSAPDGIVVAPGPGRPAAAGIALPLIRAAASRVPLLGVCLGHQAIAEAFGAAVVRGRRPMHGTTSAVEHDGSGLFAGLPDPIRVTRYHSLTVDPASVRPPLRINARALDDGAVMGLRHESAPVHGVQFHPEALLTLAGDALLRRFLALSLARRRTARRVARPVGF